MRDFRETSLNCLANRGGRQSLSDGGRRDGTGRSGISPFGGTAVIPSRRKPARGWSAARNPPPTCGKGWGIISATTLPRLTPLRAPQPKLRHLRRERLRLADGERTTLYVADSESRDGRTNTGRFALAQTGYAYNPGARRGIRIGSARDGSVRYLIPDPCPYPYAAGSSLAEGVTVDARGDVYGADFLTNVRKFVLTRR